MSKYSVEVKCVKVSEFIVEANSIKEAEDFVREVVLFNFSLYVDLINKQSNTVSIKGQKVRGWWNNG